MPSIVQKKSAASGGSPNVAATFTNNTASGNLIVAAVAIVDTTTTCGTATISDTQANTFTSITSATQAGAGNCFFTQMWYASSGAAADTVTVAYSRSLVAGASGITIYELNGSTVTGLTSSTGAGSGAPPTIATGNVSFSANAILIATLSIGEGTVGTVAAGTGFTLDASAGSNSVQESATTGITSPTTFPFSQSGNSGTQNFSEVGAQFPQSVAATFAESGAKRQYRRGIRTLLWIPRLGLGGSVIFARTSRGLASVISAKNGFVRGVGRGIPQEWRCSPRSLS